MPINTNLSTAPYFDDYDVSKQYYRVLFKPGYAVQARELTQLQSVLQNQVEQFGDNVYKEGSIIRGCNFTNINGLKYVKLFDTITDDVTPFTPESYISKRVIETVNGQDIEVDYVYELESNITKLKAQVISASNGYLSNVNATNTFFIGYVGKTDTASTSEQFQENEVLTLSLKKFKVGELEPGEVNPYFTQSNIAQIRVAPSAAVGSSFGIRSEAGIVFQKGHFLFADAQTLVVSKYTNSPDGVNVGYQIEESTVNAFEDESLYDNANGSNNFNAPGADRLKLVPTLVALESATAEADASFFSLIRYKNGNAVTVRDVAEYNVLGDAMAKRTFEESGNYVVSNFDVNVVRRNGDLKLSVGPGTAYVKGHRIEALTEQVFDIEPITETQTIENETCSFNYGMYLPITDYSGYIPLDFSAVDLKSKTDVKLGEAYVLNMTPDKVHLTGIRLSGSNNFNDVAKIDVPTGYVGVANTDISGAVMRETDKQALIFEQGTFSMKGITPNAIPVRQYELGTVDAQHQILINVSDSQENFNVDNDEVVVIETTGERLTVDSVTNANNNTQLVIQLDPAQNVIGSSCSVYYNINKTGALGQPYSKIIREPYVKFNFAVDTQNNRWSLGFPDVFDIISIVDANGNDYTDSFKLVTNQKDHYYDLSYVEWIRGRPRPENGVLTAQIRVFEINTTGGNLFYFSINSYPQPTANEINNISDQSNIINDIPIYVSSTGRKYNLRECLDFRPHVDADALADYNNTDPNTAPTILATVGSKDPIFITNGIPTVPARNASASLDVEHYLGRVDTLTVDSYGKFKLLKGTPNDKPRPEITSRDRLTLSEITIPGVPAITANEALEKNKKEYGIKVRRMQHKGYTMKDIRALETKVDNLIYYISLSQLESETQNLSILDENGLNRFKNGFVVDPFNNFAFANLDDPTFNAAIPHSQKILMPSVKQFPLDLKYKESTNASLFPSANPAVGTLSRNQNVTFINQPYATEFRNAVSNFYNYKGIGALSPEYDVAYDMTQNPEAFNIDIASMFEEYTEALQEFIPLTDIVVDTQFTGQTVQGRTITQTFDDTVQSLNVGSNTRQVGDFVTNIEFNPFIAEREIKVWVGGLRPDTPHYFFFDQEDVQAHVAPGTLDAENANEVETYGTYNVTGTGVSTDSNGILRAVFKVPAETFFVGDRVLEIADVDQWASIDSGATSKAALTYRAYNFSIEKTTLETREPETTVDQRVVPRSVTFTRRHDPLAQTFYVREGMGEGSETILASELDLYLKRKSDTNGLTVYLTEVDNGYPSDKIIPFSRKHYTPSQINVSDDASVPTTFTFDAPVRLETEREYAFVVMPDGNDPDYLVFTSKVGGIDLTPGDTQGQAIVQDWGDGVLFTSTNNRAWTAYQDEDVKFSLKRHDFNFSSGSITLTNNDHEFFTVNDITGLFKLGEPIYQYAPLNASTSNTVSIEAGNNVVTGIGFDSTYIADDYIYISDRAGTKDLFKITTVESGTSMRLNKASSFDVNAGSGLPVVTGKLSHYNRRNPESMFIEQSSARTGSIFRSGEELYGLESGGSANTASIDDIEISYVQPFIYRTNDDLTVTTLSGNFTDPSAPTVPYNQSMNFNSNGYFGSKGAVVYSKSNDLTDAKSFDFVIDMTNSAQSTTSPFIDIEISKLIAYQWKVTNTANTTSKYISKKIELAEDFDAEDFELIITGYRPQGTDIKCYIRPQNVYDSDGFDNLDWIELELYKGVNQFCSVTNINDYREFKYRVPDSAKDADGVIQYTSEGGTFAGYRRFAVRIDMLSESINRAPMLRDYRGIALT